MGWFKEYYQISLLKINLSKIRIKNLKELKALKPNKFEKNNC